MKILMVNKFHYIKGGSETYYFALKRLLEKKGHTVIDFSMKDEKNFRSPYEEYFVDNVDYNSCRNLKSIIKASTSIIYSLKAKKKFKELIEATNPDLVHLHIFQHQISPSILDVIKEKNIPVVYTAHDLKMVCLNYKMMHHRHVCEQCKNGKYFYCVLNRCVKDSFAKSCINAAEGYFHKWRHSYDVIKTIITPSSFYKQKFEEFGIDKDRLFHIPNFLDSEKPDIHINKDSERYYLYFGRLSEEKGIYTLIKAITELNMTLYVVGTGPLQEQIQRYIEKDNLTNIELLGYKDGQELKEIVGNAKAVILPSEWYENGPYSAIEALQLSRPIIGANIGGIPELIRKNGFLFESRDVVDLKRQLLVLDSLDDINYSQSKENSAHLFEQFYTQDYHYAQLAKVYQRAIGLCKRS